MRDSKFASDLAQAKEDSKERSLTALGISRDEIKFPEFSEMFLDQKVFPHHQDWIDLLEGQEPSWLHNNMIYEKGDPNRLLINVPPEHAKSTVITVNYSTYRIALNPNVRIIVVSKTLVMLLVGTPYARAKTSSLGRPSNLFRKSDVSMKALSSVQK